jgi:hypothetical protein
MLAGPKVVFVAGIQKPMIETFEFRLNLCPVRLSSTSMVSAVAPAGRRRAQLIGQAVPGGRGFQHRRGTCTEEQLQGIDLRWEYRKIHHTDPPMSPTPMTEERPYGDARREIDGLGKFPVAWTGGPSVAEQALG